MKCADSNIDNWLRSASIEERARLMGGRDSWRLNGVPALDIPDIEVADCGHGVTKVNQTSCRATCLPTGIGLAATWNPDLIEQAGALLGRECRALGVAILLGPMLNLHRLPCGGRNYETLSEDPLLAGKIGAALARGIQSEGVGACIKAFLANNQQTHQMTGSAQVADHVLRELYMMAFRIAVREAIPCAIMTSYNRVNGEDTAASPRLLAEIVKRKWGFKGLVMSDWGGVRGTKPIAAGLDVEMPGPPRHMTVENVARAVRDGSLTEAELNDRAGRILRVAARCGAGSREPGEVDSPRHRALAKRLAEESIVLLKNDGPVLPLDAAKLKRILVIGPNADAARLGGGGSASVSPSCAVSPLEGIRARVAGTAVVEHMEGCGLLGDAERMEGCFHHLSGANRRPGLRISFFREPFLGGEPVHVTTADALDTAWGWSSPAPGVPRAEYSVRCEGVFTSAKAGTYKLILTYQGGGVRMFVDGEPRIDAWETDFDAHFEARFQSGAEEAVLHAGAGSEHEIRVEYSKQAASSQLRLDWIPPGRPCPLDRAVAAAQAADAVIFCGGLSNFFEGGAHDRKQHGLPGRQDELIRRLAKVNSRTVVCLQNGTPVAMPWLKQAAAVLECWYSGQEGGNALAAILFGDVNPSGRMPDTFPVSWDDVPAMRHWPGSSAEMRYDEGFRVGYRDTVSGGPDPLFPFGYGLSYTTFRYDRLRVVERIAEEGMVRISVDVSNAGDRDGHETVQIYAGCAALPFPALELKDFKKVWVPAGRSTTVDFALPVELLAHIEPDTGNWRIFPGTYTVLAGPNCREGLQSSLDIPDGVTIRAEFLLEADVVPTDQP